MLIVCGTNVVSDYMTGPKGWPYDLLKWSALGSLCNVKVLFLGIGVGPINHPLSRWLIKRSLGLASYRSYRDQQSKQYMKQIGFDADHDPVCPDLAFGLANQSTQLEDRRDRETPMIGIGLKYYDSNNEVAENVNYQEYIGGMAAFASRLCERDFKVRLLIGDYPYDMQAVEDFLGIVDRRFADRGQIVAEPALTLETLLNQISETNYVISPRFHNLVLALNQNKPVIALSDHPKFDALMDGFGMASYCLASSNLDVDNLTALFEKLHDNAESLSAHIRNRTEEYRAALEKQYSAAFA